MATVPPDDSKYAVRGRHMQDRGRTMRYDSTTHSINDGYLKRLAEDLKIMEKATNSPCFCRANNSYAAGQQAR